MCDAIGFHKISKFSRLKEGLLSDTRVTDRVSNAKMVLILSVVCEAEVELTTKTLGHLEKRWLLLIITTSTTGHDQYVAFPRVVGYHPWVCLGYWWIRPHCTTLLTAAC